MSRIEGTWFVYLLRDPRTSEVRYVGITRNPPQRHDAHSKGQSSPAIRAWVNALSRPPVMEVICSFDRKPMAVLFESALIAGLNAVPKARLLNRKYLKPLTRALSNTTNLEHLVTGAA